MKFAATLFAVASCAPLANASLRNTMRNLIDGCAGSDDFTFDFKDKCNYNSILGVIEKQKGEGCTATATDVLISLLGDSVADEATAKAEIISLCTDAYENSDLNFDFKGISQQGYQFDNEYYSGGTNWNYEVQTNAGENVLREDASRVKRVFDEQAQKGIIELPMYLEAFDPSKDGECDMNAAFCCWVQDRQARDNNGNCNTPYDQQCIDKDPSDNANLCYVDHNRSSLASHVDGGFTVFGDVLTNKENIEGPIHCHGFAWADDGNDLSHAYRGNNLFFVSMYDHMHQRGYVRNVPGSPMCACAENMAVVTRADCTEIAASETFTISYDTTTSTFGVSLKEIHDLNFNGCQGITTNNDLEDYVARLARDGQLAESKLVQLREILVGKTAGNCNAAIVDFMATKGIVRNA